MIADKIWSRDRFPVLYENDQPKAFLVDVQSFEKIEHLLDNFFNLAEEPEDRALVASGVLKELIEEVEAREPSPDWETEIDNL